MNFNFDPSTMKSISPSNTIQSSLRRMDDIGSLPVRHYRPAVLPEDFMKRSIDNTEFLRKTMGDPNFMIKVAGDKNPFNIKAL
jgi:hypothetical protein